MVDIIGLLEELRIENGAEYVKVYFQDKDNYTIKYIKDGVCFRRMKKGHKSFDLKEDKKKGVVDKKKHYWEYISLGKKNYLPKTHKERK